MNSAGAPIPERKRTFAQASWENEGKVHVVEINPRLTTSYVGLRALSLTNLMDLILAPERGAPMPSVQWKPGVVEFSAG